MGGQPGTEGLLVVGHNVSRARPSVLLSHPFPQPSLRAIPKQRPAQDSRAAAAASVRPRCDSYLTCTAIEQGRWLASVRSRRRAHVTTTIPAIGQVESLDKYDNNGALNYGPALFVISYIVIVVWVLLQAGRPH